MLKYAAKAVVGSKLASVGSRLIESVAKKHTEEFYWKFSEIVAGRLVLSETGVPITFSSPGLAKTNDVRSSISPLMWAIGVLVLIGILGFILF